MTTNQIVNSILSPNTFGMVEDASARSMLAVVNTIATICDEDDATEDYVASHLGKLVESATLNSKLVNSNIHGVRHWMSVFRNAIMVANQAKLHKHTTDDWLESDDDSKDALAEHLDLTAVAILFSLFHDCRRQSENNCITHGAFGSMALMDAMCSEDTTPILLPEWTIASYACNLHTVLDYPLGSSQLDLFSKEDISESLGGISEDEVKSAIGMCLDADRIDLLRLGIFPEHKYMYHTEAVESVIEHLWKNKAYG